jgi:hypothetical protein
MAAVSVVVMDQIGIASAYSSGSTQAPSSSQIFPDFSAYDAMALDDFEVDQPGFVVDKVSGLFLSRAGFGAFGLVSSYQVSIFSSSALAGASLQGDVANLLLLPGAGVSVVPIGDEGLGLVEFETNILLPAAGTYWIGIAPVAASSVGEFFLQNSGAQGAAAPGNGNGKFANPSLGHEQGAISGTTLDYAYRIRVVPEPSAFCLVFGGVALLGRRRRETRDTEAR